MADLTKYSKGKRMVFEQDIEQIKKNKADLEDLKEQVEEIPIVEANPVLEGTEGALESLQVGETKYKVGGGDLYLHQIETSSEYFHIYCTKEEAFTSAHELWEYCKNNQQITYLAVYKSPTYTPEALYPTNTTDTWSWSVGGAYAAKGLTLTSDRVVKIL